MRSSLSISFKIFYRNAKYIVLYLMLLILTNCFLVKLSTNAISLAEFHLASLKIGIVGYLFFCFLGYEYVGLSRTVDIDETLESMMGSKDKLISSKCVVLIFLLLIWCINVFCWITGSYFRFQVNYVDFFYNAVLSAILDLVLPGFVAILLGVFLAILTSREIAYSIIVISALFCSPVPSKLFSSEAVLGYPVLHIFDCFSILAPNTDWVADAQYGVSVEPYRWFLAIFWVMAFLSVIIFTLVKGNKVKRTCAICMAAVSLLAGVRFACRGDDSIVRKDYRPDGILNAEFSYRQNNPVQSEMVADFSIEKYTINLTIRNNTVADVYLHLSRNDLGEYRFTLYHGYIIERIEDADKNILKYEQNGDHITVFAQDEIDELHFVYSGNAGKYYANRQGIALPGYLPFYPIPGHVKLWETSRNEIVVNTFRETSYYEVSVDSNLAVASNLPCISDNRFSGYSQTVSLYAGILSLGQTAGATYWYSPISHQSLDLIGYEETWKSLSERVGEDSEFDLAGKTIFLQPMTILATNSNQETYVEFDDHIILGGWSLSVADVCNSHLLSLIPKNKDTSLLYDVFSDFLIFGGAKDSSVVEWSSVEILTKYASSNEIPDREQRLAYRAAIAEFYNLFNYKVDWLGESYVLQSVYQYLHNPDGDQVEFLYNLGE